MCSLIYSDGVAHAHLSFIEQESTTRSFSFPSLFFCWPKEHCMEVRHLGSTLESASN